MDINKYLSLKCFIISFCVGIFMVYITLPLPEIIIRYPTPFNAGKIVYKDNADLCYVYDSKEMSCPKKGILNTPLQFVNNKDKNNKGILTNLFENINGKTTKTTETQTKL